MAFTWVISQLDSIPTLDGMDKVISVIHWRAQKAYVTPQISEGTPLISEGTPLISEVTSLFTADTYGALSVDAPHEASFTPYDEVTKEMVKEWLEAGLDCEAIEANLDAQIENFLNPPIVAYPLPWQ
jgi:hypothetical protein